MLVLALFRLAGRRGSQKLSRNWLQRSQVTGVLSDPGIFYVHHMQLHHLWWEWQLRDLHNRVLLLWCGSRQLRTANALEIGRSPRFANFPPVRTGREAGGWIPWADSRVLEPIKAAASTSHDLALPTLVDEGWKDIQTLLTPVTAAARLPRRVCALVVLHQMNPLPFHKIRPPPMRHWCSSDIPIHDDVGAVEQICLVPL
jgi:hypothetical protein